MKKALVLLLALCAVSAFAQDAAYTLEAEASVTWGYDLDTETSGFLNEASFDLVFPIAAGASAANEEVDGVYGQISITGLNLALHSDMTGGDIIDNLDEDGYYDTFEAKIIAGPMYVVIYEAPGFELNNAQMQGPLSIDAYDDGDWGGVIANTAAANDVGGVTFGYKTEMFDVALQLASDGDETVNTANNYLVGLTLTVTPVEMLEVEFAAFADMWDAANQGLTLKATVTPIEGLELVASMDASIVGAADLVWDSAFEATYTLANASEFGFNTYYAPADSLGLADDFLEFGVSATEDGEEGFVPALGASAYFKIYNVLGEDPSVEGLPAFLGATVDYTVTLEEGKTVKPYAGFDLGLLHAVGVTTDNGVAFNVGVDVNLIANTTITAEFSAGSVEDDMGMIGSIVPFGDTTDKGLFTVSCTIEL